MKHTQKMVLLFDGNCHFCTASAEWVRLLDWRQRLHCLPFQAPGVPQAYGLSVTQCEQAVWAISPSGQAYQGAQAICATFDALLGFPLFLWFYRFPGSKRVADRSYAWVAKNRRFLPGMRPSCQRPHVSCDG